LWARLVRIRERIRCSRLEDSKIVSMDCAGCEAIMDELRRGDLPARIEAEARSHLAQCPRCRAAHMRLLRVEAETSSPARPAARSPHSRARRAILRFLRSQPKAVPPPNAPPLTAYGALRDLLGRWAMAPQVAMGTVMLLIVLVGLWSLPQLTRRHALPFRANPSSERVGAPKPETDTSAALSGSNEVRTGDAVSGERSAGEPTTVRGQGPAAPMPGAEARRDSKAASKEPPKDDLATALQHYRAHEYALATPLFSRALLSTASPSDEATALLYLARSERAVGHCDRAVNSYDTLVRVHPGRVEAKAALHEAVSCYDRLAQHGRSWKLLEQAAQTRELGSEARSISAQRTGSSAHKAAGDAQADMARTD
jgi:tetratricopeptide (TPR) repeat protein